MSEASQKTSLIKNPSCKPIVPLPSSQQDEKQQTKMGKQPEQLTNTATTRNKKIGLTAKGDQRHFVQHSYTDRSNELIESYNEGDQNTLRLYREDTVGGTFPLKLQIVLKVVEKLGQQHIISWLPHGRSFMIHRPRAFEEEVMGKFFKQTKLTSFQRQLNLYDFQRITHGCDAGSYYHELFLRGRPLLAKKMVRRKVKGTKIRASSSPDDEPNFYSLPFMMADASTKSSPRENELKAKGSPICNAASVNLNSAASNLYGNLGHAQSQLVGSPSLSGPSGGAHDQMALQQLSNVSAYLQNGSFLNSSFQSLPYEQQNAFYADAMQSYGMNSHLSSISQAQMGRQVGPSNNSNNYLQNLFPVAALQQNLLGRAGSYLGSQYDQLTNNGGGTYKPDLGLINQEAARLSGIAGLMNNNHPSAPGLDLRFFNDTNVGASEQELKQAQILREMQLQQQNNALLLEKLQRSSHN